MVVGEQTHTFAEVPAHSVGDLLKKRGERKMVTIAPDATAEQAIKLMEAQLASLSSR